MDLLLDWAVQLLLLNWPTTLSSGNLWAFEGGSFPQAGQMSCYFLPHRCQPQVCGGWWFVLACLYGGVCETPRHFTLLRRLSATFDLILLSLFLCGDSEKLKNYTASTTDLSKSFWKKSLLVSIIMFPFSFPIVCTSLFSLDHSSQELVFFFLIVLLKNMFLLFCSFLRNWLLVLLFSLSGQWRGDGVTSLMSCVS